MHCTDILSKIIKQEELPSSFEYEREECILYEELDDFPTHKLICLSYNFIDFFKDNSLTNLQNFIKEIEFYKIAREEFIKIKQKVLKSGMNRETKIYLINIKREFRDMEENYKNREYMLQMLNYLYLEAIEYLRLEGIENDDKFEIKPLTVTKISERVKRGDLFVDRNQPTMSLKDYAEKIMKNLPQVEEKEVEKETVYDLRKRDDKKDDIIKEKRNLG
ncbi:hypothetical protein H312_00827 [Anncaliia algerae PRA339]|uniref:Uncharacterized protein n=1 Tax=Anncaliia algerae PRA339 TaxID=1288291 RepID=A0A059F3V4_9MICR|nr:hypothetical protein H312_00827 [Anncaliia algerae PRA339]